MILAGMDVARLNFSHGTHQQADARIKIIRTLNKKYRRAVRLLQDLEGYRIRIGRLKSKDGIQIKKREILLLTNQERYFGDGVIPFDYEGALGDIKAGCHIYIDDGNIALLVKKHLKGYLQAEVIIPGIIKENKGINIPDVRLKFKGLTFKDKLDIHFGIKMKMDYIAQSFVRNKEDVLQVKDLVSPKLKNCRVIAKIENREGIKNIDEIIKAADGIMIARGDMGVSIPIYEIPIVQKRIIKKCNRAKKIVITATQMLESMTEHIRPTRAEVTDVANAILDGTDFVMLSAETAAGKYPVESVKMMNDIIRFTERNRKGQ